MRFILLFAALHLLLIPVSLKAERALAFRVIEGDAVWIKARGKKRKIILYGIDAPERGQAYFSTSRQALRDLIQGKRIRYKVKTKDRYGRVVAEVFVGERNVNLIMLDKGLAWVNPKHSRNRAYRKKAASARKARRGLWKAKKPLAPWVYRKQQESSGGCKIVKPKCD